jgi:HK97 family phage major capsid protein
MKFDIRKLREKKAGLVTKAEGLLEIVINGETDEAKAKAKEDYDLVMVDVKANNENIVMVEGLLDEQRTAQAEIPAADYEASVENAAPVISGGKDRAEDRPFADIGDFCVSVHGERGGNRDVRLSPQAAATGMGSSIDSEGGYLIPAPLASSILGRVYDIGQIIQRVNTTPISNGNGMTFKTVDESSRVDGSRKGGVQAYWMDEAEAFTSSKLKFRDMELKVKKIGALMYATEELLSDASAITAEINKEVPEELAFKVEDSILFGNGAGKPKGIIQSSGSSALITVAKETGQAAATILHKNIRKMWARMPARNRKNAVWLVNQDVEEQLGDMVFPIGTAGQMSPLYKEPAGDGFGTIKGRPVIPVEYCETLGTAGDIILVDFSEYKMITKGGIKAAQSMHVKFLQEEMAFRFSWRVDGQPTWDKTLTPYKGTIVQSPYVRLATRS